jgi:hypothetical protein
MNRTLATDQCADCGQSPKLNNEGKLLCACPGKRWEREAGIEGTDAEAKMLKAHKFEFVHSADGNAYYMGPNNRLVYLIC